MTRLTRPPQEITATRLNPPPRQFLRAIEGLPVSCGRCEMPMALDRNALDRLKTMLLNWDRVADVSGPPDEIVFLVLACPSGHRETWRSVAVPRLPGDRRFRNAKAEGYRNRRSFARLPSGHDAGIKPERKDEDTRR